MRNYSIRKRVLVTGGAGFIGSHLCERLLADGHVACPPFVEVDEIYNFASPAASLQYLSAGHSGTA